MKDMRSANNGPWRPKEANPAPANDASLERADGHDPLVCEQLVEQYHRPVFHMVYRLTQNRADAEDITQDVFLKVLKSVDGLQRASSMRNWLFKIAVNLSIDRWRKLRPQPALSLPPFEPPGPQACVEQKELQARLQQAILQLHDKQRATLVLRIFHQLSFREIAEVMSSPIGTVKANYHHALVRLRSILENSSPSH